MLDGTDDGTLVYSMTAIPDAIVKTYSVGKKVTSDVAMTTGETQFDGIVTSVGMLM
jgi:hypothetical protein